MRRLQETGQPVTRNRVFDWILEEHGYGGLGGVDPGLERMAMNGLITIEPFSNGHGYWVALKEQI